MPPGAAQLFKQMILLHPQEALWCPCLRGQWHSCREDRLWTRILLATFLRAGAIFWESGSDLGKGPLPSLRASLEPDLRMGDAHMHLEGRELVCQSGSEAGRLEGLSPPPPTPVKDLHDSEPFVPGPCLLPRLIT